MEIKQNDMFEFFIDDDDTICLQKIEKDPLLAQDLHAIANRLQKSGFYSDSEDVKEIAERMQEDLEEL
jgi:bifunctional DNA-binding transcriptional regulator/antitoxin component of YhaV-PrlF toxin-antitoxin module